MQAPHLIPTSQASPPLPQHPHPMGMRPSRHLSPSPSSTAHSPRPQPNAPTPQINPFSLVVLLPSLKPRHQRPIGRARGPLRSPYQIKVHVSALNFKVSRHQDQAATFGLTRHTVADFNPSPLSGTGRPSPPVVSEKGGKVWTPEA